MPMDCIPTIEPDWPPINGVHAFATTRLGGVSTGDYRGLNLGDHVGDTPEAVANNRDLVFQAIRSIDPRATPPRWLTQVHGVDVANADDKNASVIADASVSQAAHNICVVMTADCLPLLIAAKDSSKVAAVHAGWKGLADGVIEAALKEFADRDIQVWLGPCIGIENFEVGPELLNHFPNEQGIEHCFVKGSGDRWHASLAELARARLHRLGVTDIYGGDFCTYRDPRFYSHRQATHLGQATGRLASMIWKTI